MIMTMTKNKKKQDGLVVCWAVTACLHDEDWDWFSEIPPNAWERRLDLG